MKTKYFKVLALIAFGVFAGLIIYPLVSSDNIYNQWEKYKTVFSLIVKDYVDTVDTGKLTEGAIRGMLSDLDPHSVYMSPKQMKAESEQMEGSFEGIGVEFDIYSDTLTVISPIKGGPSEAAGIMPGDKIIKVNDGNAVGITRDSVPKLLRGPKGTLVKLDIYRKGEKGLLKFDIIRDKIPLYSVYSYMLPNTDIGILSVNRFAGTTHEEMLKAARELKQQGMQRLILDLRGNGGGLLPQAYYMADEFLERDTIVYTVARRTDKNQTFIARKGNELENIPLVVLIDAGSASASEIVSGSIQDLDRGLIVGTNSFGKGLVQSQIPLTDGSAIRLTLARYYTASGRCIQRPYEDKEDYRRLVGRLELEEGSNLEHALDKIKKEEASKNSSKGKKDTTKINMDSIEVFHTRSGRPVIGGGGITPDYIVKYDSITMLSRYLYGRRVIDEFIAKSLNNGKDVKEKYGDDFNKFIKEFEVTNSMIKDLKELAASKDIEWDEDKYRNDEPYIKNDIKAQLARIVWDMNRSQQVRSMQDRQIRKASELFPVAEKIRNQNKAKKN